MDYQLNRLSVGDHVICRFPGYGCYGKECVITFVPGYQWYHIMPLKGADSGWQLSVHETWIEPKNRTESKWREVRKK